MIAENLIGFEDIPQTIPHYCLESFRRHNKRDALSYKINDVWENLSGEAVIERIKHIALGLADLGIKAGDRIAIISENRLTNRSLLNSPNTERGFSNPYSTAGRTAFGVCLISLTTVSSTFI
jgi:acyl-CoA synthetase (AMP-forming)/AMP-acid ligase II